MRYNIVEYKNGQFAGVLAGLGRHKGTWDSDHSRSTAFRHVKALRIQYPGATFCVESQF